MRSRKERTQNNQKQNEQIVDAFGLPRDLFLGQPLLSMAGNRSLCITNHRGIRQYSDELIVVAAKPFSIQIVGRGLLIPRYSKDQMEITGYMEGIAFLP